MKTTACPRQDSNLRTRLRRPMLYPLSYEGVDGPGARSHPTWPPRDGVPTVVRPVRACPERPRGLAATGPPRRILAAPCPSVTTSPKPSAAPSPPSPPADGLDLAADPASSTSSARPVASTATGPPTWPWCAAKRAGTNPRALATVPGGGPEGRSAPPRDLDRDRRSGIRQLPPRRRLAARRPGRGARPGRGRVRPARRRPRRAGPGRVHLRQPHRPDPCGQRLVGELRRRPGPGAGPGRATG